MSPLPRRTAPILVAADDDWEALGRMVELMADYEVISARTWPKLRSAVERFQPDLVLMADTLRYPRMTAQKMVARLFSELRARIVVLSEFVSPDHVARWRERGAVDCLLHPTKVRGRMVALLERMFDLIYRKQTNVRTS